MSHAYAMPVGHPDPFPLACSMNMVKISTHYRWFDGARFDAAYYESEHMRITLQAVKPLGLLRLESDRIHRTLPWLAGQTVASTHAYFASLTQAQAALAEAGATLRADLPHYTNIRPELVFGLVSSHGGDG